MQTVRTKDTIKRNNFFNNTLFSIFVKKFIKNYKFEQD